MPRGVLSAIAVFVLLSVSNGAFAHSIDGAGANSQGGNSGHVGCVGDHWGHGLHKGKSSTSNNSSIPIGISLSCLLDVLGFNTNSTPVVTSTQANNISFRILIESFQSNNSNFSGTLTLSADSSLQASQLVTVNQTVNGTYYTTYLLNLKDSDFINDTSEQVIASVTNIETSTILNSSHSIFIICECCGGNVCGGGGGGGGGTSDVYVEATVEDQSYTPAAFVPVSIKVNVGTIIPDYLYWCTETNAYGNFYQVLGGVSAYSQLHPLYTDFQGTSYAIEATVNPIGNFCSANSMDSSPYWSENYFMNSEDLTGAPISLNVVQTVWVNSGEAWYDNTNPVDSTSVSGDITVGINNGISSTSSLEVAGEVNVAGSGVVVGGSYSVTTSEEISIGATSYVPCSKFSTVGGTSGYCGVEFLAEEDYVGVVTDYSETPNGIVINTVVLHGNAQGAPIGTSSRYLLNRDAIGPQSQNLLSDGYYYSDNIQVPPNQASIPYDISDSTSTTEGWSFETTDGAQFTLYGVPIDLSISATISGSSTVTHGMWFDASLPDLYSNYCSVYGVFQEQDLNPSNVLVNGPVHVWLIKLIPYSNGGCLQ